jgi:tetrahydromethanopterin S-methyltransferase subunit B
MKIKEVKSMAIAHLRVKIDSEGMLAKVQEINEKAQELDRLVKELRSMSGEFVSFNSDDLIKVSEEKTEK